MKKLIAIIGTLTVLALVMVIGVVTVGAQTEDETPAEEETPAETAPEFPAGHLHLHDIIDQEAIKEVTADALGMTVDELDAAKAEGLRMAEIAEAQGVDLADVQAAVLAAVEEMVLQAVDDGELAQEDADRILERLQAGQFSFGPGRRGRHEPNPLANYLDRDDIAAATAEALDMTVEELQAARVEGQTLAEIAEAQGVELTDVQAAAQAVYEEAVADALDAGAITEEEAQLLLEREIGLGGFGPCQGGRGGFRGPRGFGGPGRFGPDNLDSDDTTNTLDA